MRVWVDCTAAAHPLVLRPVVERLEGRGHEVFVTAREYGQTLGVLDRLGIPYESVGAHAGASTLRKGAAVAGRSAGLAKLVWGRRPDLALAHGSVDLALVSWTFRIPSVQMQDYEFAGWQRQIAFRAARRVLAPDSIPVERLRRVGARERKLVRFPGLKEEYYLAGYDVYGAAIRRLATADGLQAVVIPRTEEQGAEVRAMGAASLVVPERAIDAQSLIAFADLVVSAGGTMNREAVALGTPVFTTFAGRMGGVDEALIAEGRLRVLDDPAELPLRKREAPVGVREPRDPELLVDAVLGAVE
jgi:predicted glycosyltransferase